MNEIANKFYDAVWHSQRVMSNALPTWSSLKCSSVIMSPHMPTDLRFREVRDVLVDAVGNIWPIYFETQYLTPVERPVTHRRYYCRRVQRLQLLSRPISSRSRQLAERFPLASLGDSIVNYGSTRAALEFYLRWQDALAFAREIRISQVTTLRSMFAANTVPH